MNVKQDMRKLFIRFLIRASMPLLFLCSCSSDYSLDIYGTISGKVTDVTSGEPINAAQVTLVPSSKTIQTTENGEFVFSGLEEGQYTVSVQKDGYQANRKNVTVVSGETTETIVTLSVIPKNGGVDI